MDYMLDTNLIYMALYKKEMLPKEIAAIVSDTRNNIYMSAMSIWEVLSNNLRNPGVTKVNGVNFYKDCIDNNFVILPLLSNDIVNYEDVRIKKRASYKKDPYDRMLVAQARHSNYLFLTCDKAMKCYDDPHILVFESNNMI